MAERKKRTRWGLRSSEGYVGGDNRMSEERARHEFANLKRNMMRATLVEEGLKGLMSMVGDDRVPALVQVEGESADLQTCNGAYRMVSRLTRREVMAEAERWRRLGRNGRKAECAEYWEAYGDPDWLEEQREKGRMPAPERQTAKDRGKPRGLTREM